MAEELERARVEQAELDRRRDRVEANRAAHANARGKVIARMERLRPWIAALEAGTKTLAARKEAAAAAAACNGDRVTAGLLRREVDEVDRLLGDLHRGRVSWEVGGLPGLLGTLGVRTEQWWGPMVGLDRARALLAAAEAEEAKLI